MGKHPVYTEIFHGKDFFHLRKFIPGNSQPVHSRVDLDMHSYLLSVSIQDFSVSIIHHRLDEPVCSQQRKRFRMSIAEYQDISCDAVFSEFHSLLHTGNTESLDSHILQLFRHQNGAVSVGVRLDGRHKLRGCPLPVQKPPAPPGLSGSIPFRHTLPR